MKTFRTIRALAGGPRWLTTGEGRLVNYALDLLKDGFVKRLYLGLLARFPQDPNDTTGATTATPDALAAIGRDRRVVRGIAETDASYARRLITWLDDRQRAGNPFMLMQQLAGYVGTANGVSFRTVDTRGNWYARDAAGVETSSIKQANWNWDGLSSPLWSRFWVIIYPGTLWSAEGTWGTGTWGDTTGVLGATVTQEQAATLRTIVADWKPAGTRGEIILALGGTSTFLPTAPEPDGLWGKFYKYVGGVAVATRLASGRYFGA